VIVVFIVLAAAGVGTCLAALTVAYRDFRYIVPFLVQFWLFATPVIYSRPPASQSFWLQLLIGVNPLSGLIAAFRAGIFGERIPWPLLATSAGIVILLFAGGCLYFRRVEDDFADVI
jgi:lipopolysaccharide transport system permease protein